MDTPIIKYANRRYDKNSVIVGYSGILIDRNGYNGEQYITLENEISEVLNHQTFVSPNERYAFNNLTDYATNIKKEYSEEELLVLKEEKMKEVAIDYGDGFTLEENDSDGKKFSWAITNSPTIIVNNPNDMAKEAEISMFLTTHAEEGYKVLAEYNGEIIELAIDAEEKILKINAQQGATKIVLYTDAPTINPSRDIRTITFAIIELQMSTH